jgi:hypothetical protein
MHWLHTLQKDKATYKSACINDIRKWELFHFMKSASLKIPRYSSAWKTNIIALTAVWDTQTIWEMLALSAVNYEGCSNETHLWCCSWVWLVVSGMAVCITCWSAVGNKLCNTTGVLQQTNAEWHNCMRVFQVHNVFDQDCWCCHRSKNPDITINAWNYCETEIFLWSRISVLAR